MSIGSSRSASPEAVRVHWRGEDGHGGATQTSRPMPSRRHSAAPVERITRRYGAHEEATAVIAAAPAQLFEYLDDPRRLGSHMDRGSWRMAGASMTFDLDDANGRAVGSRIRLAGKVLGLSLALTEVVTRHAPPLSKAWQTIGSPRLIVIGPYRMGFEITPLPSRSRLTVFIDYAPPPSRVMRLLPLLGRSYARWCIDQMVRDAKAHFARADDAQG